jgi:hypothetical protein
MRNNDHTNLMGYVDADWAGNPFDKKSITDFCMFVGETYLHGKVKKQTSVAIFSAEVKKQTSVAIFSAEVEYCAILQKQVRLGVSMGRTGQVWVELYYFINFFDPIRTRLD